MMKLTKVIPILPCPDIRIQTEFYQKLGFTVREVYKSPSPYAVVEYESIELELHFWGSKKNNPAENPSMCYIQVSDVDALNNLFISALKRYEKKIPRSGIPRISKVRDLKNERRFTLTDAGGNTLFIGTPAKEGKDICLRTIQNKEHSENFAILYDLLYSKEDANVAANMLPRLLAIKDTLCDLDKAKLLLIELDIKLQLNQIVSGDTEITALMKQYQDDTSWDCIRQRYNQILCE